MAEHVDDTVGMSTDLDEHDEHDDLDMADLEAGVLLDLAEEAIRARLARRPHPVVDATRLPPALHRAQGVFVTLHVAGALSGCIGNVEGSDSLAVSVAELAVEAAFHDPRLPALRHADLARLSIEISLLSAQVDIPARSRDELLRWLRPDEHGLVIRSGDRRALFLPPVWRQLPRADDFIDQLLRKAGLRHDTWPENLAAAVFTTRSVVRDLVGA